MIKKNCVWFLVVVIIFSCFANVYSGENTINRVVIEKESLFEVTKKAAKDALTITSPFYLINHARTVFSKNHPVQGREFFNVKTIRKSASRTAPLTILVFYTDLMYRRSQFVD